MERIKRISLLCAFFWSGIPSYGYAHKSANQLNWIEVSHNRLSIQIMFDFAQPVVFNPIINQEKQQLSFSFPEMKLDKNEIFTKLGPLKNDGFLKSIDVTEKTSTAHLTQLALEFAPYRTLPNIAEKKKNKLVITWNTLKNPNRIILNIFLHEKLEALTKKDAILLYASNDTVHYDVNLSQQARTQKLTLNNPRIIIDPGHGGPDLGTQGHQGYRGMVEKDLALDIARNVHVMLKKKGHRSLLTRSADKTVTLLERSQIANQLKGDFFVSIHVNSSGSDKNTAWGCETCYFDSAKMSCETGSINYFFLNVEENHDLIQRIENHTKSHTNKSCVLASNIQTSIVNHLQKHNFPVNNRGIKKENFRVLLQSGMPAVLIEVGFLTNQEEAHRLSRKEYRHTVAQAICDGICSYIATIQ